MRFQGSQPFGGAAALAVAFGVAFNAFTFQRADAHCGSCGTHHDKTEHASASASNDVVDTAVSAGDFGTLVAAVKAADLVDALKGDGPFTVFAPNDAAFAKLPESSVQDLLKPENRDKLRNILTYHVVAGRVPSAEALKLEYANALNGQRIDFEVKDNKLFVEGAQVIATDIETSNGVIHVIDSVIMPTQDDILETAAKAGSFKTLAAAIQAAGLVETLKGQGPFTVFAPTDEAFARLPQGTLEELLKPANRDKLTSILTYHVVSGRVYSDQALSAGRAATLQKSSIEITTKGGRGMINDATLVKTDIDATNGVIHVIDTVLIPSDEMSRSSAGDVREIIRMAINTGAPLYNHGQPEACAAVYEMTANSLLQFADMEPGDVCVLRSALRRAQCTRSADEQAWILRHALDTVFESKSEMLRTM